MFPPLYKGFQSVDLWGQSHKMDILQQKKKFSLISFNDHMKQLTKKKSQKSNNNIGHAI